MPRKQNLVLIAALLTVLLVHLPSRVRAAEVSQPQVVLRGDDLHVTARLVLDEPLQREIRDGVEKKLVFYLDLFRAWYKWPDEFIAGKKLERLVRCDNIKGEYAMTTEEWGRPPVQARFESCDALLAEALAVEDMKFVSMKEFEHGRYFVRVTAESRLRNLLPLFGKMFFFVKEKEFEARADSKVVRMGGRK
jgi:hypothetical protein